MSEKVWLVTGCSTGFGRALAQALVKAKAKAVLTARLVESLAEFAGDNTLLLPLDVTDGEQIEQAVAEAQKRFGRIDVLVNNAGYGVVGALEETDDTTLREVFNVNVFGLWQLTRDVLPLMRAQKAGHIINMSSVVGVVATPGFAAYCATKFALEGLSKALALEVAHLGINVTLIEPGPFRTDFADRSLQVMPEINDYAASSGRTRVYLQEIAGRQPGDPERAAAAVLALAEQASPPLHLPLGNIAWERIGAELAARQQSLQETEATARGADYHDI